MKRYLLLPLWILFAGTLLAGAQQACTQQPQFTGECSENTTCPSGYLCRGGLCVCRNDESCEEGQFCNTQGICQERAGCVSNSDCEASKFCNVATGVCVDRTACGTDVHCVPGQVCNAAETRCVDGCRDDGDCPLYNVCEKAAGAALGACIQGKCGDKSFCAFGERCMNGSCARDNDPNHCAPCDNLPGQCGSAQNYCLINVNYDPSDPSQGTEYYCGVNCQQEADCPNGYGCGPIILLTQALCTTPAECGGGGRQCVIGEGDVRGNCTCATDTDCNTVFERAAPATCVLKTCGGLGLQPCQMDSDCSFLRCEGSGPGQCQWPQGQSCVSDSQCQDLPLCADLGLGGKVCVTDGLTQCNGPGDCLCRAGTCLGTGRSCQSPADCSLSCQGGGCVLGAACGPIQGVSCEDLR
ncbi:MAG: hypothetical protein HY791_40165 [Deltaproteobacteria bacterium]|nr:hypothetical protein [Deltaproteobacteria bacterium]